jgi:hypothetical protein
MPRNTNGHAASLRWADAIIKYFWTLRNTIDNGPAGFVWNMDEIDHSNWADAHPETVYLPGDFPADQVLIPVNRAGKRITLVGCIRLDGSFMKPMVVIPRHTVDKDFPPLGVSDSNCHTCHQRNGFIDRELVNQWFKEIFLSEVKAKREVTGYSGPAFLVLDDCTAHDNDSFLDTCIDENVIPIPIATHASNQVQPCDLCVFGLVKRIIRRLNRTGDGNIQSIHIEKLVATYHSACNPINVIASFRNAGITARFSDDGTPVALVDDDECRCLLHLVSMEDLDGFDSSLKPNSELDDVASSEDLESLPFWLRALEEEASQFPDEKSWSANRR